jgi:hypothetical protein
MENENINYNLIEPPIFSIPKKTELKDFDNYKVMNEPVINITKKPLISSGFVKQPIREYSNETNIKTNYSTNNLHNPHNPPDDISKISVAIKKLFNDLNIKEGILKVFGTEKIIIISILAVIRIWVKNTFPSLNQLLFKEKYSSLVIGYTHYTSSYYTAQNNEADSMLYKSILYYIIKKNVIGVKYVLNTACIISHFDKNVEIKINKKIYVDTKVVVSSTATVYEIEIYSFSIKQDKLKCFLNKCIDTYKKYLMNTTNYTGEIHKNHKFYSYQTFNNQANSIVYEENKFFSNKTFDNIFFENKDNFMKKINYFCDNRGAYRELGIPYSCGVLLEGPPGTGKTSLIKALANHTGRCVIDINLSKLKFQKELKAVFIEQKINNVEIPQDKRLYVFEEFDCIMDIVSQRTHESKIKHNNNDNKNHQKIIITEEKYDDLTYMPIRTTKEETVPQDANSLITLDTLLNIIDGTFEANGQMIILTTNFKEKIDKALLRPGRFDCHVHLDNATPKTILQMINHFYNKNKDKVKEKDFIENYTDTLDKLKQYCYHNGKLVWSPAKITQICLSYMDDHDYLNKIIEYIKENYEEEKKILEFFNK